VWRSLSLRYKVPLNLSIAILFTGVVIAAVLIWRSHDDVRVDLFRDSVGLSQAMNTPLADALKHDDPWRAYKVLRLTHSDDENNGRICVLVRPDRSVYVSSDPKRYPMDARLADIGDDGAALDALLADRGVIAEPLSEALEGTRRQAVLFPVTDGGAARGTLVMIYPESVFAPARDRLARRVTLSMLVAFLVMLPVAWYVGKRTVNPLMDLAKRMDDLGHAPVRQVQKASVESNDEIGQLARRFNQMLDELEEKEQLERQVIVSERLAALGRVVTGVAHEINNPLGGMLNSINTHRRFGRRDDLTDRTIALLERGLNQIRETVSALLVEARAERHGLSPADVDDVLTLIQPDANTRGVRVEWENRLRTALAVPATPVRQMLINLTLNAVQAGDKGGTVRCRIAAVDGELDIYVENDGTPIPEEQMGQLFEPFTSSKSSGLGLGLWVTYQIVRQLQGEITVTSEDGITTFRVTLPLTMSEAA
jgi:signal transduction histidine kinase